MLDFVRFCLNLVGKIKFELEYQFISHVFATAGSIHYALSIDISITCRKPGNGKFTPTLGRPSERSPRDKSNGDQIALNGAVLRKLWQSDGERR
ncbi:hypothetical protein Y032_0023g798 [Ancylostoma ceylanicum]|uniref:Uncharacterized protein n=1 Tax=Ancylostoma ceylanicum TaxID=53326 RepID=A0A016UYU1_9BILA|nr:hypothetical protein Y032_0023g798 [Ancylostoma ceylanicum]